jgi:integrase
MKSQHGYLTKKSGSWLGHYSKWILDHETGQRKRVQRAFKIGPVKTITKTKAGEKLQERLVKELGLTGDSRITFKGFTESRWKPMREGRWRPSTVTTNQQLLETIYKRFGNTPIEDMKDVEMQSWLNTLAKEKSGSVVKHCRIFLRSVLAEAVEADYLRKSPAKTLHVPRTKRTAKDYLSKEEIEALLEAASEHLLITDRLIIKVFLVTGARPGEIFALRWKAFNEDWSCFILTESIYRGEIRPYTKTTEQDDTENTSIAIPSVISNELAEWYHTTEFNRKDDFIFPNDSGGFWWKENWHRRRLTPLVKAAGIKHCNYQTLRRTFATHAAKIGSVKDVSTILRHRSTEVAQRNYIQSIPESVRTLAENLADNLFGR